MNNSATIYTDGSCNPQRGLGAWVAIILTAGEKVILTGRVPNTTHNRMELTAVINGITYIQNNRKNIQHLYIYSDSQYVTGLMDRQHKLSNTNFITSKGNLLPNAEIVQQFYTLSEQVELTFTKIKAHQKSGTEINYNIEADKLVRKILREDIRGKSL